MEKCIKVPNGATVKWKVSCDGFEMQSGTQTIDKDTRLNIDLLPMVGTVDVSDYEYTLNNDTLTLATYIGTDTSEVIPHIER